MSCEVTLTDKIKIKNQNKNSFSSEEEFDNWLFQNRVAIKRKLKLDNDVNSPTFAINLTPVEERKAIWDAFLDKMKLIHSNSTELTGIDDLITIGTTTVFRYIGNKNNVSEPVNKPFETKMEFIQSQTSSGKTISEAEEMWRKRDKMNALVRLDGNIFGALVEDALIGTSKNLEALRKKGLTNDLTLAGLTFDQAVQRVINVAKEAITAIKNDIVSKYGSNAKIYSEVEVVSRKLGNDFKAALSVASLKAGKNKSANAIQGFLDLVIQTDTGELHTYDIKLSTHKVNDWWAGTSGNWKYDDISAQQMAYATMARQWGINFNSINIIPAYVKYDDNGNIVSIEKETFKTFSLTNPYALACERYFPVSTKTNSATIVNLSKLIDELYPGLQLDTKAQTMQMSKDFVVENIIGKRKSDGKYHLKLDDDASNLEKEITFNTEEERDKYIDEVYIPNINEKYSKELRAFGNELRQIADSRNSKSNKIDQLFEMARGITKNKETQEWIVNKFKKYAIQGWDLVSDDDNLLADYGIFIFIRNGLAEIVMMDKTDLYSVIQMGKSKNTTVLGMLKHDLSNGMDDNVVLKSLRGHLMAMKAAAFISQNETTLFNGIKIQAVKAINMYWKQAIEVSNDKLLNNWNSLCGYYNIINSGKSDKTVLRTINKNTFLSTALSYVNQADDIANTFLTDIVSSVNFKGHNNYLSVFADDSAEDILRYMANLKSAFHVDKQSDWQKHSDEFEAYMLLSKAYAAVRGFQISAQNGVGDYISNGIFLTGARSSSPAESNSPALRVFNQIETTYEQKLRDEFRKFTLPWQNQMVKVYQENGIEGVLSGNERDLFKMCFEQDEDGNIAEEFCLIPPDENRFLDNKPELKKLVKMFLETINLLRIPDESNRENLSMKRHSLYYQVPLTEASFRQKVKQGNIVGAVRQYAQNTFEEMREFAYGKPLSSWQIKKTEDLSSERVYDPYLDTSYEAQEFRRQQLSGNYIIEDGKTTKKKYGINTFELSLDTIFLRSIASALRASTSKEFMPLFNGLRVILAFNDNIDGAALEKVQEAVKDFIRTAVFGKNVIDPDNQRLYKMISLFRKLTSTAALAFNTVSFTREQLTSAIRTSINKEVDPLMKGQFNQSDYVEAVFDIIEHAPENIKAQSKYMQFNFIYGLANASEEHLAEASKSGWLKPSNWTSDLLFWTSTSPDFVHRNAILQAILRHRGSFNAYEMTENEELIYNMDKDQFYEIFWKYKGKYSEIQDKDDKLKFKQQERFYMNALEDWNKRYGMNLKYGDPLPQALSPTEANAIRVYADHMYGNYDKNTKSLLQRSLIGSVIFQFKTYTLQRFLQSFRDLGYTNITRQRQMETDDGEKVYFVPSTTPDEISKYGHGRYLPESKVPDDKLDKAEAVIQFAGSPTGGKVATNIELMKDIFYDRDKFFENWKNNDVYRANLYLSLIDNFGMLIMMMLLKLIYGEETVQDLYNQDWWTRWSYTVLLGVAQDGPIDQVVGGLVGGGTPPSIAVLQSFFRNTNKIITGEDTAIYGFMNSFGATRQFAGMFANAR